MTETLWGDYDEDAEPIGLKDLPDGAEVTLAQAAAFFSRCSWTHPDAVIPVWEPGERFYGTDGEPVQPLGALPMNRVGCTECNKFVRITL